MMITPIVKNILSHYPDNPGVKSSLARILMHGKLGGTGKLLILPVDQGFEHGPARSFAPNPAAYDPLYHFDIAIEAGLNAYAAPLGMLEMGADKYAGEIPLILKLNSGNSLSPNNTPVDQAITGSIKDALRLGCSAVGFTIYPGSEKACEMMEEIAELGREAKDHGLAVVIWSYPRGPEVSKTAETALDMVAYAAHMAALLGASIIKVKPPTEEIAQEAAKKAYEANHIERHALVKRISHVMDSAFNGKRVVVFSGGVGKTEEDILEEVHGIRDGGGNGSIIGRNTFQRPRAEALNLLNKVIETYKGQQ